MSRHAMQMYNIKSGFRSEKIANIFGLRGKEDVMVGVLLSQPWPWSPRHVFSLGNTIEDLYGWHSQGSCFLIRILNGDITKFARTWTWTQIIWFVFNYAAPETSWLLLQSWLVKFVYMLVPHFYLPVCFWPLNEMLKRLFSSIHCCTSIL